MNSNTPEHIKNELYSRVCSFFGPEGFNKVLHSFVVVVGVGGVGSHAAHLLLRSGVTKIRIIDFDQVSLSSLNRHAVASMSDVGTPKVMALKKRLQEIVPWCDIDACNELFSESDAERLLSGNPDYVIDCIDDVETKAQLIAFCTKRNINIITSLGAGTASIAIRSSCCFVYYCLPLFRWQS
jgi:tRNA A37 threonylcarbamoyladenosine dehydratase